MKHYRRIITACLMTGIFATGANALTGGPVQPEFSSFEAVDASDLVNIPTGDFTYVLPLGDVRGPAGVGYPIALSYHAGILNDQEASWVGLGWSLNAGAINRTVRGFPDDFNRDFTVQWCYDKGDHGWGADIGIGWGPISASVQFSYKASAGYSFDGVGIGIRIGEGNFSMGLGVNFGKQGTSLTMGMGFSPGGGNIQLGASISIGSGGMPSFGASVGFSDKELGSKLKTSSYSSIASFSISSTGHVGMSMAGSSASGSSQTISEKGLHVDESSFGITIPLPFGFSVSIGYYDWSWYFAAMGLGRANGYLFPNDKSGITAVYSNEVLNHYLGSSGGGSGGLPKLAATINQGIGILALFGINASPDIAFDVGADKYEQITSGNNYDYGCYCFPAQDDYIILGQGIGGVFQPFSKWATRHVFDLDPTYNSKRNGTIAQISSGTGTSGDPFVYATDANGRICINTHTPTQFSDNFSDGFSFRILGDNGLNLIDNIESADAYTVNNNFQNIDASNTFGTRIEPIFGLDQAFPRRLCGFVVTDQQGKTYFYTQPLFQLQQISYQSETRGIPTSNGYFNISTNNSYNATLNPYATTWLLTAITGPDYIKKHGVTEPITEKSLLAEAIMPHDSDYGYWVRFRYQYGKVAEYASNATYKDVLFPKTIYQWRLPYCDRTHDQYLTTTNTGKTVYSSTFGERELTYLKSIETAQEVAFFKTSDRQDGFGVDQYPSFAPSPIDAGKITVGGVSGGSGTVPAIATSGSDDPMVKKNQCMIIKLDKTYYNITADKVIKFDNGTSVCKLIYNRTEHWSHYIQPITRNPVQTGYLDIVKDFTDSYVKQTGGQYQLVAITNNNYNSSNSSLFCYCAKCFYVEEVGNEVWLYVTAYNHMLIDWTYSKYWNSLLWYQTRSSDQQHISTGLLSSRCSSYEDRAPISRYTKKLDEIAWYSKAQCPQLEGISDPEEEQDAYGSTLPQSYRRVKFNYNYECAQNTTNSVANGRLTLKTIWTEAGAEGSGAEVILPPYQFTYQGTDKLYLGFDKVDPWGFRKETPDGAQDDPAGGVNWNLSSIQDPSGAQIDVEYERDYANSSLANVYKMKCEEKDPSVSLSIPCYGSPNYGNYYLDKTLQTGASVLYPTSYPRGCLSIEFGSSADISDLSRGIYFLIDWNFLTKRAVDANNNRAMWDETFGTFRIDDINISGKKIFFFGTLPHIDDFIQYYNDDNVAYSNMTLHFIKKAPIYCDGLRVKKIISSANSAKLTTTYKYSDASHDGGCLKLMPESAIHKGLLDGHWEQFWCPPGWCPLGTGPLGEIGIIGREIMSVPFSDDLRYNYSNGNTMIIYPYVEISQTKEDGVTNVNGMKKYYFWTADDLILFPDQGSSDPEWGKVEPFAYDRDPEPWSLWPMELYPMVYTAQSKETGGVGVKQIWDRSGLIGMPKMVQFFDNTGTKLVYQRKNSYVFGNHVYYHNGAVYGTLNNVLLTYTTPLGVINERSVAVSNANATQSILDLVMVPVYASSVEEKKDGVTTITENAEFDARTGTPLVTVTKNSDGHQKATMTIPYNYIETNTTAKQLLNTKNVHTLQAGNFTVDVNDISGGATIPLWNLYYNWLSLYNQYIRYAAAQTYKKEQFSGVVVPFTQNRFWLNKSYSLKDNSTALAWPTDASATSQWLKKSEILKVDKYTRPQCEVDALGRKTTAIYHPRMNAVVGSVSNAAFEECGVFPCDYDEQDPSHADYFDYPNGWQKGGGCEFSTNTAYLHFGKSCIHIKDNSGDHSGPSKLLYGIAANKKYTFSACVYDASSGSSAPLLSIIDHTSSAVGTASVYNVKDLGGGWKLISRTITAPANQDPLQQSSYLRISVDGSNSNTDFYVDDIRFAPEKSLVSSYYYDQNLGVPITFVDANSKCRRYEYDAYGRLRKVRNNAGDLLKEAKYGMGLEKIQILSPAGGEIFPVTFTMNILWSSQRIGANLRFYLSTDGGTTWYGNNYFAQVVQSEIGNNTLSFTIPSDITGSNNCIVKIEDVSNNEITATSGVFTIVNSGSVFTSPVEGEKWVTNSGHTIAWTYAFTGAATLDIYYFNGTGFDIVAAGIANTGGYVWAIPYYYRNNPNAYIKIIGRDSGGNITETIYSRIFSVVRKSNFILKWIMDLLNR